MHIALFSDLHPAGLGGAQTSVAAQRHGLEQLGHKVTVFTAPLPKGVDTDPNVVELMPVPVVAGIMRKLGRNEDFVFVWPSKTNRALIDEAFATREPIDVVHAQGDLGVAIAGIEAARRHGIPVVQTKHTRYDAYLEQAVPNPVLVAMIMTQMQKRHVPVDFTFVPAKESAAARLAWRAMVAHAQAVDHGITPSQHFANALVRRGVDRPISAVSNGVEDEMIDRARLGDAARPSDDEPLRLVWCGRVSPEKRVLAAVEAAAQVDNCTLDIYGEGHLVPTIRKTVESAGVADRIRLRGRVSQEECLKAMRSSHALLCTSYGFDTQGIVLLEAIAMSTPVVYCDPVLRETVPDGGGLLASDPSPESIAAAIRALADDRDKLRRMTDAVTAHRETPRQSLQTEKIVDVYHSVLDPIRAVRGV